MISFTVDSVDYEFDEAKVTFGEARAIEKVTGHTFGKLDNAREAGEIAVTQAFIWVAMKRKDPTLTFSGLDDLAIGDIVFHEDPEEVPTVDEAKELTSISAA